jgi:hypothetical protein
LVPGEYTQTAAEYKIVGSGNIVSTAYLGVEYQADMTFHDVYVRTYSNCNCNCACRC